MLSVRQGLPLSACLERCPCCRGRKNISVIRGCLPISAARMPSVWWGAGFTSMICVCFFCHSITLWFEAKKRDFLRLGNFVLLWRVFGFKFWLAPLFHPVRPRFYAVICAELFKVFRVRFPKERNQCRVICLSK